MKTALDEAQEDVRHYFDLWKAAEAREARLREEVAELRPKAEQYERIMRGVMSGDLLLRKGPPVAKGSRGRLENPGGARES